MVRRPNKEQPMAKRFALVSVMALLLAMLSMSVADAKPKGTDRPFKGEVAGDSFFFLDNPNECPGPAEGGFGFTTITEAEGRASHMGRVVGHFEHCPLLNGDIVNGTVILEAANGDELHGSYSGTSTTPLPPNIGDPVFATLTVTWDPDNSTGRFAGATGTAQSDAVLSFQGLMAPSWPITITWQGALSY
jgi:hypothetical protein